jgi:hypothetical protein
MAHSKGIEMKSTYNDDYMHKVVLLAPMLGKKTPSTFQPIVLGLCASKADAIRYQADAERRYSKRPGRIMIVSPKKEAA